MSRLSISCSLRGYRIDERKLRTVAHTVLSRLGLADYELAVQLVGSARIRRLNKAHRGKDKATDVLSFPQEEFARPVRVRTPRRAAAKPRDAGPPRVLGDVVISLPDAEKNARRIGQELDREVCFLLVHGILHLGGHDHMRPADERRMLKEQRSLMTVLSGRAPLWSKSVRRRAPERARA